MQQQVVFLAKKKKIARIISKILLLMASWEQQAAVPCPLARAKVAYILRQAKEIFGTESPLVRLWEVSHLEGRVLVLPQDAAIQIVAAHPRGYHHGCWHLVTEYEVLCAKALLWNANPHALGFHQPKTFSAWPRRRNVHLYREAQAFRSTLRNEHGAPINDVTETTAEQRLEYMSKIRQWHESISYISHIDGNTRLDAGHLDQLVLAF